MPDKEGHITHFQVPNMDHIKKKALPAKRGSPNDFQTPPIALLPLLPYLNKSWTIWECAEGMGWLTKRLRELGFNTIGSDINTGEDFLTWKPKEHWDVIVTNPPYSIKDDFLLRAYELGKPFAFLLPPRALEGLKRQALYKEHGVGIIMFNRRVDFRTPSGEGSGSWFPVAWFTHGLGIDGQLRFGEIPKRGKPK